ncbi:MAG: hypothetical protein H7Z37_14580 [Pyrinomonadaceae bacterium]|nr:hypothetical protein [Pyrinomonadaceae bacterium]
MNNLQAKSVKPRWIFGIIAALVMTFFALYPQINLMILRGADYNGAFASNDTDEAAYAAYLQALIDDRPRKNDPYAGRDESEKSQRPETLFSVQFLPPYLIAIPARFLGLNASQTLIFVAAIAAFLTTLVLFWLIFLITGKSEFAAIGALAVLCFGVLASGNGAIQELFGRGSAYPYLPFLRRYIPAVPFPIFFAMFGFLWLTLKSDVRRDKTIFAVCGGLSFAFLVFSYFYLWTTAAAFLFALTAIFLLIRPPNWKREFCYLMLANVIAVLSLAPYFYLLSQRDKSADSVQHLLVYSHAPDVARNSIVICWLVLLACLFGLWKQKISIDDSRLIFLLALICVPLIVFNQQIITGFSLQPFHYEFYIVNYLAVLVIILGFDILLKKFSAIFLRRTVLAVTFSLITFWGFAEVYLANRVFDKINISRDEMIPVTNYLVTLSKQNSGYDKESVTLNFDLTQADNQPTFAPQAVLWARHQHIFAGVSWEENKRRYFQSLYYLNVSTEKLKQNLKKAEIESCIALFGWDRFNYNLSVNARPLTDDEIQEAAINYETYQEDFDKVQSVNPQISFVIVPVNRKADFSKINLWYDLDEGETKGSYILHRATPKK